VANSELLLKSLTTTACVAVTTSDSFNVTHLSNVCQRFGQLFSKFSSILAVELEETVEKNHQLATFRQQIFNFRLPPASQARGYQS
jgi:hypothetical protein